MPQLGTYLTLTLEGSVIAEASSVSIKVVASALDSTSKDSGLYSGGAGGLVKIGVAGSFLYAASGNWSDLYDYQKAGTAVTVTMWRGGVEFISGEGVIKKLSMTGSDPGSHITGAYGIRYTSWNFGESVVSTMITEDELYDLITEDGDTLIFE